MSATNVIEVKNAAQPVEKVHKNVNLVREQQKYGCKTHGIEHLTEDISSGDVICTKCALVVEERMLCDDAEWRNFEGDTQAEKWAKSRVGDTENPFLGDNFNLGTMVQNFDKNSNKVSFSSNILKQYKRRSVDNALSHAFKEIDTMGDRKHLPAAVTQKAKALYSQLYRQIKLKGNILFVDSKTAACLYIACRLENCYQSTREIASIYDVSRSALSAAITRAKNVLNLKMPAAAGAIMIDRYAGYLDMTRVESKRARRIADAIELRKLKENLTPDYVAATSMYLAVASTQGEF